MSISFASNSEIGRRYYIFLTEDIINFPCNLFSVSVNHVEGDIFIGYVSGILVKIEHFYAVSIITVDIRI